MRSHPPAGTTWITAFVPGEDGPVAVVREGRCTRIPDVGREWSDLG